MIRELTALTLTILIGSSVGLVTLNPSDQDQVNDQVNEYVSIINRMGDGYKHTLDDLCGMMEIAQRFRDDPDYHYDPADMDHIIMRDGVNGTQELIDTYNELLNATLQEITAESGD
jgi:hypothetical protein